MDNIQLEESAKAQHHELCRIGRTLGRHARRKRRINDDTLRSFGVVRSSPLEVDDRAPCDFEPRFFMPSYKDEHLVHAFGAGYPKYITGLAETGRRKEGIWGESIDRNNPEPGEDEWFEHTPDQYPSYRFRWFAHCLDNLQQTDLDYQECWEDEEDRQAHEARTDGWRDAFKQEEGDATFRMPAREEMDWDYRRLSLMQPRDPARPHLAAVMGDSEVANGPEEVLVSELHAAVELSKRQVSCGDFLAHHTRPVIIYTLMSETHGRITQAHFDAKTNKMVLRQSRVLDFQAKRPTPDAYLLLRWMMNIPAGETAYTQDAEGELEGGRRPAPSLPGLVTAEAS